MYYSSGQCHPQSLGRYWLLDKLCAVLDALRPVTALVRTAAVHCDGLALLLCDSLYCCHKSLQVDCWVVQVHEHKLVRLADALLLLETVLNEPNRRVFEVCFVTAEAYVILKYRKQLLLTE